MLLTIAWLGGVLFAASLGWCIYLYAIVLGTPGEPTMPVTGAVLFDIALFSIFALHHSLLARSRMKRAITRLVPVEAERTTYVWIASLLLILLCWQWQPVPGVAYVIAAPWHWLFHAVQAAGIVLTWRGAAVIDPLELAGIRQAQGDLRPPEFRVAGPFRVVRHPIYLGWLLMVFGAPTMTWGRALFAGVSTLYLVLAIPWEERSLAEAFGERYRAYQATVRWRIIPGVW